jgi:hypothetical protein
VTEVNTDEGITIQSKKGSTIHKNASETDPALKIDHNGTDVVKRSREIEVVENTGAEQQSDEAKPTEDPATGAEDTEDAPVDVVDSERQAVVDDASVEKKSETALDGPDQDVEMPSPKKNGNEKSAGEKRDRDDLEDLEEASPEGEEAEADVDAGSTGSSGVKKHKTEHSENDTVAAALPTEEAAENGPVMSHIDENLKKVEAEGPVVAAGEGGDAVPA